MLGISKRGNGNLHRLFIHGARSVAMHADSNRGLGLWLSGLEQRAHKNVAIVALVNKIVRISWAVLARNQEYRAPAPIAA